MFSNDLSFMELPVLSRKLPQLVSFAEVAFSPVTSISPFEQRDVYKRQGFGNSLQKLGFVPEAQNDMIFSIICEEMGAAGAIFLIFLFAMLLCVE